jgi:hypothetical protein
VKNFILETAKYGNEKCRYLCCFQIRENIVKRASKTSFPEKKTFLSQKSRAARQTDF